MFLRKFNASDISPEFFVDHEEELKWLVEGFSAYFEAWRQLSLGENEGLSMCLLGEKGIGKSMLAERLMRQLRAEPWTAETIFIKVDCRNSEDVRRVLQEVAVGAQRELTLLDETGTVLPRGLLDTVGILVEITRYSEVEFKTIQESILRYRMAAELNGHRRFLSFLSSSFRLSLEIDTKSARSMIGSVKFDEQRLVSLLLDVCRDLREAGLGVFLLLDNVDELRHEYRDPSVRDQVRKDLGWLFQMSEAPIAILACMRTYLEGSLPRKIQYRRSLKNLGQAKLIEAFSVRAKLESQAIQEKLAVQQPQSIVAKLAERAPTPLAFVKWVDYCAQRDFSGTIGELARDWLGTQHSVVQTVLPRVLRLFAKSNGRVTRAELLTELANNQLQLDQLQDLQVVLPVDFWNPNEFTMDPELAWVDAEHL